MFKPERLDGVKGKEQSNTIYQIRTIYVIESCKRTKKKVLIIMLCGHIKVLAMKTEKNKGYT